MPSKDSAASNSAPEASKVGASEVKTGEVKTGGVDESTPPSSAPDSNMPGGAGPWLELPPEGQLTPMMAQYAQIKRAHSDCLLFYRLGDFYELFFRDAVQAAEALDIALTHRGEIAGRTVPMCGVPAHSHESYLARLIEAGFKVAICEQTEDPAQARARRGHKALVGREVRRIATAGTLSEDSLLEARQHNYLAALARAKGVLGLAWLDMTTGRLATETVAPEAVAGALARGEPAELLVPEKLLEIPALYEAFGAMGARLTRQADSRFDSVGAGRRLADLYKTATLDAFGAFSRAEIAAAGAAVDYVELTQKGKLPRLQPPRRLGRGEVMEIDAATRRNLELTRTLAGARRGSLLDTIDHTVTAGGGRLLAEHLALPLTDPAAITARQDKAAHLGAEDRLRADLRAALARCPDGERALSRLSLGRGGPRDLAAIRDALAGADIIRARLSEPGRAAASGADALGGLIPPLSGHDGLRERLDRALAGELPALARDGGFIAPGYSSALDELRSMRDESKRHILALQQKYAEHTGIQSLKIRRNNVLGYYIEVTARHADKLMSGTLAESYIHRQTLANQTRFTTTELAELEQEMARAGSRALELELELFEALVAEVTGQAEAITGAMAALARLDVAASHAELAARRGWCRPVIDDSTAFEIEGGRHPVVELAVDADPESPPFVANECRLSQSDRIWLLTGPNMAGKSTFLRQNALIAILAQMGAWVPARSARIGAVDRLFSRVGAADDLARGRSTFMVEMVETSAILNQAGPRALVILDEIGRGTATYDGLSLAWACLEHIHGANGCRALFATHYHELVALAERLDALSCHTMKVKEWADQIVFLHEVVAGAADRSYGLHVARLAGLPAAVIRRAEEILAHLENDSETTHLPQLAADLPLFSAAAEERGALAGAETATPAGAEQAEALSAALGEIDPDALTPREALETLYRLKETAREAAG